MHANKTTIQKSAKAYLRLVLHMNEAQVVHIFYTITQKAHVTGTKK